MSAPTEAQILAALKKIPDPDRAQDIVALGMVQGVIVKDGHVMFSLEVDAKRGGALEPLRKAAEKAVESLPGVLSVSAVLTAQKAAAPAAGQRQPGTGPAGGPNAPGGKMLVPGVRAIVAVASGKGGVGKSTTATNLAVALSQKGLKVGILDADIYGPSQPRMLGISGKPKSPDGKTLTPMENYGIKCMSIGFLVPEDTPMIWRGPMVMGALEQMLRDVAWGELDILVVDMPPGTGDAQLTMSQRVPLAGAVIVSTPQDIALLDARKGLNMFRKVDVPVFGIVENMSYHICTNCGHREDIFGHGGARREAEKLGVDFLGEVPLDIAIRETSDAGTPITARDTQSAHAKAYRAIADAVWSKIETGTKAGPRIVIQ
ncbi:MAG: iron-sulfur cluster carrier protein ApbC [Alphaproteobacteria bacterium]|nr:iron-sulfur cluster carrier protein ApbC [Alphaproteobacteria bacterium]